MNTWLDTIVNQKLPPLAVGSHLQPSDGLCAMEMVAFMEGLPHSDSPICTCPVIAEYVRAINDAMPDDERHRLLPYLSRVVGTVSNAHAQDRKTYLMAQAAEVYVPLALLAAGMPEHAVRCEEYAKIYGCTSREFGTMALAISNEAYDRHTREIDYGNMFFSDSLEFAGHAANQVAHKLGAPAIAFSLLAMLYATEDPWARGLDVLNCLLAIGPESKGFTSLAALPDLMAFV